MKTAKQIAAELMDEFMWCATSTGHTAPLAKEVVKDIVAKHIELLTLYETSETKNLCRDVLIELEKL